MSTETEYFMALFSNIIILLLLLLILLATAFFMVGIFLKFLSFSTNLSLKQVMRYFL
jgi:hypothetical protein